MTPEIHTPVIGLTRVSTDGQEESGAGPARLARLSARHVRACCVVRVKVWEDGSYRIERRG